MIRAFTKLSRNTKRAIFLILDGVLLPLTFWAAWVLRVGKIDPHGLVENWWAFAVVLVVSIPIFIRWGLYRTVVRYMGIKSLFTILYAVSAASFISALIIYPFSYHIPRSAMVIYWLLALLAVGGSRVIVRALFYRLPFGSGIRQRVAVYGAGDAGAQLVKALQTGRDYYPCFFIDSKRDLHGAVIHGVRVHAPKDLEHLIAQYDVSLVLLAIPSASRARRREILYRLESLPVHVKILPGMADIVSGEVSLDDVKEVDIEDLLGRDSVVADSTLLSACISGKSVMVTGAGGSIGSELCRQILTQKPSRLVLYEMSEFALYQIEHEFSRYRNSCIEIVPVLGSVLDAERLSRVMAKFAVQTVYHAAAYKHVPLVEVNPIAGIRNNVYGTLTAAQAAQNTKVETFILISTDKAVRPTNVMGASKRMAELVLQGLADSGSTTRFAMVRFGNVLGSSGSVVPLFRKQILQGGPVTVTHPDIIRYFMTIPEAAQLVIQAGSMGKGGDVFLLDMGEPVRIVDMARRMIRLSGLEVRDAKNPDGDIEILYTGLRPGEKLYEELLIGENPTGTMHPRIMTAHEEKLAWPVLESLLSQLEIACKEYNYDMVRAILCDAVPGYTPQCGIKACLWKSDEVINHQTIDQMAVNKVVKLSTIKHIS